MESPPSPQISLHCVSLSLTEQHKYGYAAKGASILLFKDAEVRKHQFYVWADWAGGLFGSPTMLGTRGGLTARNRR
jgi:glutamate/tyrosine decarboxylase-like PLP-dependent enzyme